MSLNESNHPPKENEHRWRRTDRNSLLRNETVTQMSKALMIGLDRNENDCHPNEDDFVVITNGRSSSSSSSSSIRRNYARRSVPTNETRTLNQQIQDTSTAATKRLSKRNNPTIGLDDDRTVNDTALQYTAFQDGTTNDLNVPHLAGSRQISGSTGNNNSSSSSSYIQRGSSRPLALQNSVLRPAPTRNGKEDKPSCLEDTSRERTVLNEDETGDDVTKNVPLWQTLQQDCSFFYQDMLDEQQNQQPQQQPNQQQQQRTKNLHPWRAIVRDSDDSSNRQYFHRSMDKNECSSPTEVRGVRWNYWHSRNLLPHQYRPFNYNDAITVVAPPVLQRYRIRYEQLNQTSASPPSFDDEEYDIDDPAEILGAEYSYYNSDLYLSPASSLDPNDSNDKDFSSSITGKSKSHHHRHLTRSSPNHNRVLTTDTVEVSTLFYESYNGRLLMRLPRDRVRLLQDPDLEPGILSVEQWRLDENDINEEEHHITSPNSNTTAAPDRDNQDTKKSQLKKQQPTLVDLRYTLTVPDSMYRMIVSEMSYRYADRRLGLYHCCSSENDHMDEKVDICVAIALLVLFFGICGFYTLWFHEG